MHRALADRDPWFTDNMQLGVSAKETIEGTQGVWIVEFGELSGMERREREQILTFLSRQEDRARPHLLHSIITARDFARSAISLG
jgi:predicted P-loop ATPase